MKKILCLIPLLFFIQPAFAEIVIQNDQPYIGDDGVLHIVGEIQNNSKNPLNKNSVRINFFISYIIPMKKYMGPIFDNFAEFVN